MDFGKGFLAAPAQEAQVGKVGKKKEKGLKDQSPPSVTTAKK